MQVERLAEAVEAVNPNRASLSSPLVNGKWRLLYTTSSSILGTSRPPPLRPGGDIFQTIGAHLNLPMAHAEHAARDLALRVPAACSVQACLLMLQVTFETQSCT